MRDPETAQEVAECGHTAIINTPEGQRAWAAGPVSQSIEVGKKLNSKE